MKIVYQTLYWVLRRLAFGLYGLSKKLDWLCYNIYPKADFKGSVGRRQKGKIF